MSRRDVATRWCKTLELLILESTATDDDWEKELFGEDLKAVQELAQKISEGKVWVWL